MCSILLQFDFHERQNKDSSIFNVTYGRPNTLPLDCYDCIEWQIKQQRPRFWYNFRTERSCTTCATAAAAATTDSHIATAAVGNKSALALGEPILWASFSEKCGSLTTL